jgi:hypothetical protein
LHVESGKPDSLSDKRIISHLDGLAKSLRRVFSVIPAEAGIQSSKAFRILWIPVFTGMTTFYEFIILMVDYSQKERRRK